MFSSFSVRKPYTIIVAVIIIAILGGISLVNMSTDLFPSINLPYAIVLTSYDGASPEEVEMVVSKPLEQRMASVSNIQNVNSISRENMSVVVLEFTESTNMDSALIEIREGIDMIMGYISQSVPSADSISTPIIMKINPDMMPVMVLSASLDGQDISESTKYIENKIIPELEGVEGIGSVESQGLLENEIHAIITDDKLKKVNDEIAKKMAEAALALQQQNLQNPQNPNAAQSSQQMPDMAAANASANQNPASQSQSDKFKVTRESISGILKAQNFSMPSGYITENDVSYLVRTGDKIKSLDELKKLPVMVIPNIKTVLLEDVANIVETTNSVEQYTKVNGNDAVILSIQKQTEYTTSEVAQNVRTKIESMEKNNGVVKLVPLMDQGEYIDVVVDSIGMNLIIGAVLAVLILLIFLRDIKPTIVIGFAIPVSLVTAFVMMYFSNISLNIISMGGLALGVGMLVDNSIVVIENIYRMRNEGKSAVEAAIEGAKQVSGAITASTLTTVAVFLPILFTEGLARELFTDMGLTIAYSLIASLVIALTLVPMISSKILIKNIKKEHRFLEWIKERYTSILKFSLKYKVIVIFVAIVLFAGSIYGAVLTGVSFFPESDTGQLNVTINMPKGSIFNETVAVADDVVDIISKLDDVETIGASLGNGGGFGMGGMRGGSANSVSLYVLLKEDKVKTTKEISNIIREDTKDLQCDIVISDSSMDMSQLTGGAVSIEISGKEFDTLEKIATDVAEIVENTEGTIEIDNGIEKTDPEISVTIDKEKSIANGFTIAQVYGLLSSVLKDPMPDTALSIDAKDYNIFIKDDKNKNEMSQQELENIELASPLGTKILLKDIADIKSGEGFSSINRVNQQRFLTVKASLEDGYRSDKVNTEIKKEIDKLELPSGYSIKLGGEYENTMETFVDLFLMLALAIVFIYLIMVAQFQSLLSPLIVMFTIPLAFTGGLFGLIITQNPISVVAMIGLIVLSGVVVNNGIVFVDYVNIMRKAGLTKKEAIIKTGQDRLRPIIMTVLTTIFALSTLSVGVGQGSELMQPMAITAIGGLIYATILTLLLIPVLYDLFNKEKRLTEVK